MKPVLVLALLAFSAFAQTKETIVVTASALPEKADDTPAAVSVVTRADIDRLEARDVLDALRHVPGISVSRTGSPGKATAIFVRGANSNQTLVLWNGIEIVNPMFGGYDWGQFTTAGIEQIEIVRGPFSALYGSDAVAGVINVITEPTRDEMRGDVEVGGRGLRNASAMLSRHIGAVTLAAAVESTHDDGFAANDFLKRTTANGSLRWALSQNASIGITARHASFELGVPTNLDASLTQIVASPNRRQEGHESQIGVPFRVVTGALTWDGSLAEARRKDDFTDPDDPFGLTSSTTDTRTRQARLTARVATGFGTLVFGGEHKRALVDDRSNFGVSLTGARRTQRSFFVEDRISRTFGSVALEGSLGVRRDSYETFGSETSPRFALALRAGDNRLRAAYGQAFRAPTIAELFSPFGGNPNLKAENTSSVEIGYDRFFGPGSKLSVTAFRAAYRNLITNAGFVYGNVGRARSSGVEIGLEHELAGGIYTAATYTYVQTRQLETGRTLLRRPRNSGSLLAGVRRGPVDANLSLVYSGKRADILPVLPFSRTTSASYNTVDLNVQYTLGRLTPYVKIENATDERYEEVRGYPSPKRRAVVGLRVGL